MRASALVAPLLLLLAAPVCQARWRAGATRLAATESSQAIQNERANAFHLTRLRNLAMVREFHSEGLLVSVPARTSYYYLDDISPDYSYLRPWAKLFLDRLGRDYYARFGQPLRVTSLLRTVQLQRRLAYSNPNAAQAVGADRSSHLTGATLDISKHFMDYRGELWMRRYLLRMEREGYLYAIEEFHEPCFHVMVFPTYRGDTTQPRVRRVHRPLRRVRHRIRRAARPLRPSTHPAEHSSPPAQPAPAVEHPVQPAATLAAVRPTN
jgi:hypothetical protein